MAELATRFAAAGHAVEVITQAHGDGRCLSAHEVVDGVEVRRFRTIGLGGPYEQSPGLWRYLLRHAAEYDLVHAHSYHATPALAAAVSPFKRLVFTPHYHGTGHTRVARLAHGPYRVLGRRIFDRCDRVISVSVGEANLLRTHFPRVSGRIEVIANGIDGEELRNAIPFETSGRIVLYAGRLEPHKNVDRIVDAFASLPRGYKLVIVGDGPTMNRLRRLADGLGLSNRVDLLGTIGRSDLCRWYRTAAVFVTMSASEAFGIAPVEALAAGSVVVASDIPSHREIRELAAKDAVTLVPLATGATALARAIMSAAGLRV
ncbi:MAG: glycosyltransferase family 4 protein, partial [Acidimicrobiales bacterium]